MMIILDPQNVSNCLSLWHESYILHLSYTSPLTFMNDFKVSRYLDQFFSSKTQKLSLEKLLTTVK